MATFPAAQASRTWPSSQTGRVVPASQSGRTFPARASGVSAWVGNRAGQLDGVDEYLTGGTPTLNSSGWSVSMWAQRADGVGNECLIGRRINSSALWTIYHNSAGTVTANWRLTTTLAATTGAVLPSAGTWYHLCVAYDTDSGSQRVRVWVNGVLQATQTGTLTVASITGTINVGRDPSPGNYLNGKVCDVALWNVSLTDANATALYNGGVRGDPETLSGLTATRLWPFQSTDNMTGGSGSIADYKAVTNLTPTNTESGDLVAGP